MSHAMPTREQDATLHRLAEQFDSLCIGVRVDRPDTLRVLCYDGDAIDPLDGDVRNDARPTARYEITPDGTTRGI